MTLYKKEAHYHDDTIQTEETDSAYLIMCITLKGTCEAKSTLNSYQERINKDYTVLDMVNNDVSIVQTPKNTHKKFVGITLQKEFLAQNLPSNKQTDKILNFFQGNKSIENLSNQKTHPKTQALALEIFNTPYINTLDKLYTESKVLELIYTEFTHLYNADKIKPNTMMRFSNQDKEALYHAREILKSNLSNPPSMKELARKVAINDLKLKVGFHKYFNETPYSISLECRLQEAKNLLEQSELNVGEISQKVGYKYTSNFTKAFIKRFGIRPKDMMKHRIYY